jgi:periplasmic divalent cation tolerance protein
MSQARIVLVTHPPRGARAFAHALVEKRLAACVNLVPLSSVFTWRGRIESARETLLVIKTTRPRLPALARHVETQHPHDTSEFVVLTPSEVAAKYMRWLGASTVPGKGR